jgi:phosphoglycerate dehydrogenase-like enzyme
LPAPLLFTEGLPLRYVCHTTGSVKGVVPREFIAGGGLVTNWGNLVSRDVAEHALFLILSCLRNLSQWYPHAPKDAPRWGSGQAMKTRSLRGKTVGIHGFGGIARELVRLLKPFDVRCLAFSPRVPDRDMEEAGVVPCRDLKELFMKSSIVVECEALTPETTRMVREEHFALMPPDGVFVNVARGAIVDERALESVAASGRLRVASDVFTAEPLPEHSALRRMPGVIVSPHIGGPTSDSYARCGEFALNNLQRYLKGQPVEGVVSLEIYDRST